MDALFGELRQMMQAGPFQQGTARFDAWHKLLQTAQAQDPARYAEEWVGYLEGFDLPKMTFTEWAPVLAWATLLPGLAQISLELSTSVLNDDFVATYAQDPSCLCVRELELYLFDLSVQSFAALWESPMLSRVTSLKLRMGEEDSMRQINVLANSGNLANVSTLELSDCELTSEALEPLWSSPYLNAIKSLILFWNDLDAQCITAMSSVVFPSLESLNLGLNEVGDQGLASLVQAPWFGQLKSLDLWGCAASGEGLKVLCSSDNALEKLVWEDNAIDLVAIEHLVDSSFRHQAQHLNLSRCGLSQDMLAALCAQPWPGLEQLLISHCTLDARSLQSIVGGTVFPSLVFLSITSCEVTAQTLLAAKDAPGWSVLRELGISYNPLQPEGIKALAMLPLDNLKTLYLNGCQVGYQGALALAQARWMGNDWVDFNLNDGDVTDQGLEALLATLNTSHMASLDLALNRLTDEGARLLAHASMPQLRGLYLGANEIGEEGAEALTFSSTLAYGAEIDISENECAAWDLVVGDPMTYYDSWE